MAIFIPGMRCTLSGRAIDTADEAIAFPAFIANEADPLYIFSDAVVHADAFKAHPLSGAVQVRLEEAMRRTAPASRECAICGRVVTDHNDYFGVGHLIESRSHPLNRFNYAHFHRSCLATWPKSRELIASLVELQSSGAWKGDTLKRLISALQSIAL